MGWCGGTEIFDDFVGMVLDQDLDDDEKRGLIKRLVVSLENNGWYCQSDNEYYNNTVVENVFRELHPDWFEDEMDELQNERNHLAKLLYQVLTEGEITSEDDQTKFLERYESGYYK